LKAVKLAEQISSASPVAIRETVKALRGVILFLFLFFSL